MMRACSLCFFLLFATEAIAQSHAPDAASYMLIGQGNQSCGTWTAARRERNALGHEQWVVGFLSGVGYMGLTGGGLPYNPLRGVDADAVWAWIDNYCSARPLDRIKDAAVAFMFEHPGAGQ